MMATDIVSTKAWPTGLEVLDIPGAGPRRRLRARSGEGFGLQAVELGLVDHTAAPFDLGQAVVNPATAMVLLATVDAAAKPNGR